MTKLKKGKKTIGNNKNSNLNFPCGNLEEMLRMAKKSCSQGDFDCGLIMKHFMEKGTGSVCSNEKKKEMIKAFKEYCQKK